MIDLVQAVLALGLLSAGVYVLWGWPYAALVVGGLLWIDTVRRSRAESGERRE